MADDGGFTRVAPAADTGGFERVAPAADTGGFERVGRTLTAWERLREIPQIATDIPFAVGRSARDSAIDAHERLNPFSEAYQQGAKSGNWTGPGTFLGTGKGLFNAAMAIPSAVGQVVAAPLGHAWSALTGNPFHDPTNEFSGETVGGTAAMGLSPRARGTPGGIRETMQAQPPMAPNPPAPPGQQFAPSVPLANPTMPPAPPGLLQRGAQNVERIFSPETVDANANQAVTLIRAATGKAARDTAVTDNALEPYHARINALDPQSQLDFINYVETRSQAPNLRMSPEFQPVADELRTAFVHRENEINNLPNHQGMNFIEDYFPHFWKDPNAAAAFAQSWTGGAAKQGSGASLKARTIPTIADGIAAGLVPLETNPINSALRYVQSMDLYIASEKVRDAATTAGLIKFVQPKIMGASGHPESFKVPDGWVPLKGRGARNATGAQAYAPEGFATVYNNFLSRGVAELGTEFGTAMTSARRVSNSITAMELGLSGYHAMTMMQESMVNSLGNAMSKFRAGQYGSAAKSVAEIPFAPITYASKGSKLQAAYLGKPAVTPEMQQIAQLLEEGGGRAKGARHAPDYEFSRQGSYYTAWKRGELKWRYMDAFRRGQLKAELIGDAQGALQHPVATSGRMLSEGARHIGRIMDTVAQPLFEKYIPLIKNGAFYENMKTWLEANPGATREQQVRAARQILDSVDNRFGEMIQDNVFWNRALKEVAMLSLRSWSWTVGGSIREIGGGVRDIGRAATKKVNPADIGPNDKRWTQKMDYVIALPIIYGALAAVYQGLKTGEPPKDLNDIVAPRTGGVDANSGQPERLLMPGYMKDVFGFIEHTRQEGANKIATGPRVVWDLIMNENWRRDPIRSPRDPNLNWVQQTPKWLQDYWKYATETFGPITVRNAIKGQKEGSNLNLLETTLGVRTAPRQFIDPEGHDSMMGNIALKNWQKKLRYEMRDKARYGGTEE